jgi:hypothetical protein
LKAAGSDLQHVLRCGVFLLDMKDFNEMNAVYSRVLGEHRPARTDHSSGRPARGGAARRDRLRRRLDLAKVRAFLDFVVTLTRALS